MNRLIGCYTALITPMREGEIDLEGLKQNIDFQVASGVDGIVVLGSTGESPTLTPTEKEQIIECAVAQAGEKVQVIVGTGASSTAATLEWTNRARSLGADAALIVAPSYNRPTQKGIFAHYETIANAMDFPLIVYNHPGRTGVNIDLLTLREIARLPNIVGIKEAAENLLAASDIVQQIVSENPQFTLLSGNDHMTLPLMALGGHGVISTVANLTPVPMVHLVKYLLNNDMQQAREVHYKLHPLFKAMNFESNPIPIKEAMQMCGLPAGPCRMPLTPLSSPHRDSLFQLLQDAQLMPAGARQ